MVLILKFCGLVIQCTISVYLRIKMPMQIWSTQPLFQQLYKTSIARGGNALVWQHSEAVITHCDQLDVILNAQFPAENDINGFKCCCTFAYNLSNYKFRD